VDDKFYGQALRKSREKAGMNQKNLGKVAGLSLSGMSALETKGQGLRPELFIQLCQALEADPLEVADRGYRAFRQYLGEMVAKEDALRQGPAVPSVEEVVRKFDSMTAASRSFLLTFLGYVQPEQAASAFLADRFQDLDRKPEPPKDQGK
jgi:transcriptional regulator with XRE-family HTH domain